MNLLKLNTYVPALALTGLLLAGCENTQESKGLPGEEIHADLKTLAAGMKTFSLGSKMNFGSHPSSLAKAADTTTSCQNGMEVSSSQDTSASGEISIDNDTTRYYAADGKPAADCNPSNGGWITLAMASAGPTESSYMSGRIDRTSFQGAGWVKESDMEITIPSLQFKFLADHVEMTVDLSFMSGKYLCHFESKTLGLEDTSTTLTLEMQGALMHEGQKVGTVEIWSDDTVIFLDAAGNRV
jgi:outer membrane murein-binding lipoprotein Lpp